MKKILNDLCYHEHCLKIAIVKRQLLQNIQNWMEIGRFSTNGRTWSEQIPRMWVLKLVK